MFTICRAGVARRRNRVLAGLALMFLLGSAHATEPQVSVSLDEAVHRATARAAALQANRAQVVAATEEVARAGRLPDPQLMAGIVNWPITGPDAFALDADMMTMQRIGLSQKFPARAKREASRAFAQRLLEEGQFEALALELDVGRETAKAWTEAWAAQLERDALGALLDQAGLASRLARARAAAGTGALSDALAAQAAELELENALMAADGDVAAAQARLDRWVGPGFIVEAGSSSVFGQLPHEEIFLLAHLDTLGPVLSWQTSLEVAAARIGLARAEKRPDWNITASYGHRQGGSDMVMLEFAVDLPLFPGNRQDRGIAAREAEYQAALASREDAWRQLHAQIRSGAARWRALREQVQLDRRRLLPLAHDRSEVALSAYRGGASLHPWLEARRVELDAIRAHRRRLGDLGQAWAALAFLVPRTELAPTGPSDLRSVSASGVTP